MIGRALCSTAAIFSLLVMVGGPVHAESIALNQVVQVLDQHQNSASIALRNTYQSPGSISSEVKGSSANASQLTSSTSSDSLFSGVGISGQQSLGVALPDVGDVEGTICDCGEIPVAAGLPRWPWLFLTAAPLLFIHDCNDCDDRTCELCETPTPTPTPNSTPTPQVPEPASLFLLGSGLAALGAGLRRRHAKTQADDLGEMKEQVR